MSKPFVPDLGIIYPDKPDTHMLSFKKIREIKLDADYPFLDKSFKFKFMRFCIYATIFTVVFLVSSIRNGLKIEGKENLRKYKKMLKNGAMTVSNHIHRWDFLFVLKAVRYRTMYFPVWKEQLNGPDEWLIRSAGGIPIPDEISTIKCFNRAFDEIHKRKKWMHVFPESCRWDYYQPIRPFKKGVFTMAYRYNLPVIPMAFSYRERKRRKFPGITLRIGQPLFFDPNLGRKEAVIKMRKECHEAVVRLAGITNNPYPAEGD